MRRLQAYLQHAEQILLAYQGDSPFVLFIKNFFRQDKKYGSRDRKAISELCYAYFRLGNVLPEIPVKEKMQVGLFLCSSSLKDWEEIFPNDWHLDSSLDNQQRIFYIQKKYPTFSVDLLFPLPAEISGRIDKNKFVLSHFSRPDLFIRCRPGKEKMVEEKLRQHQIQYQFLQEACMALPVTTKLDTILHLNEEAVIQDYSSQQTSLIFKNLSPRTVWDCCAGSGGKSILAKDVLPDFQLYVSDTRKNILHNLQTRFRQAGIAHYHILQTDLAKGKPAIKEKFDLVLCDAPCSGSGTWGRTPEWLLFFKETALTQFAGLQKNIIRHTIGQVEEGGYYLYITCSVFTKENEEVIDFIMQHFPFSLIEMRYFTGYENRADTMFAALLKKK